MKNKILGIILAVIVGVSTTGCSVNTADSIENRQEMIEQKGDIYLGNSNKRAVKMLSMIDNESDNILVSPMSIELALSMLSNGLDSQTRQKIETYLGKEVQYINENGKEVMDRQNKETLSIANSVWIKEVYEKSISETFESVMKTQYNADIGFISNSDKPVNSWVNDKTNGMIPSILNGIPEDFAALLVNAVYFNGTWVTQFNPDTNRQDLFITKDKKEINTEYMTGTVNSYIENSQATGFIKEYKNGYSFVGILPKQEDMGIENLNIDTLMETKTINYDVDIMIPKFESEYSVSLVPTLGNLGLTDIFKDCAVDNIVNGKKLKLNDIIHKTAIKMNEKGTEASAVTALMIGTCSIEIPKEIKRVYLNRPFIYIIMDNTNEIVFIGKVNNPTL